MPSPLVYMVVSNTSSTVFAWFVNITTVAGLIGWVVIEVTYLRFYYALKKQNISRDGGLNDFNQPSWTFTY
jgi:amino acid transporter